MSHTPGPWSWTHDADPHSSQWTLSPGVMLVEGSDGTPGGDEIDRANARLIAAAPDLLEASEPFQKVIQEGCDDLPDDTGVVIKIGERVLDMSLTLADFRKLEAALVKAGAFS